VIQSPLQQLLLCISWDTYEPNIIIIANINAVVEKLEGKINIKVINTGSQVLFSDSTKSIGSSLVLISTLRQNKQY
jgi:hypothetical protein